MNLDPYAILSTLGVANTVSVEPVKGGTDMAIWRVATDNATYALRVFREGQEEDCAREVAAMRAAADAGVAVPAIQNYGMIHGYPVMLIGWCDGRTVMAELQAKPWRALSLGVMMGREQAKLHRVVAPPELVLSLDRILAEAPDAPLLRATLSALNPLPDRLLHGDYHPLNVMTDGARITGVIDWANVAGGDPRFDAARTGSILRLMPVRLPIPHLFVMALLRVFVAGWRRGYEQVAGQLGDLAPFYVWAGHFMRRDLAHKVTPRDLERITRWTRLWERRAGLRSLAGGLLE